MNVLSLFDGMSCGMIAMKNVGVQVDRYVAYEIDKYAIKASTHNFPEIEQKGDVFTADFTEYEGFDWLIGGSPCTYWSIAQKNNRETEASGLGWELFSQYVRALHEAKPKYFIYENNKSMSKAIRDSIRETFGFEEICINSALLSAQNRQRYYWVGKRNEDGTYSKVDVQQPEDRGILLRDVLDGLYNGAKELTEREMEYMVRETKNCGNHFDFGYIQKGYDDKSKCLTGNLSKGVPYNVCCEPVRLGIMPTSNGIQKDSQGNRIYSIDGKSVTQSVQGGGWGAKTGLYAVPVPMAVDLQVEGRKANPDGTYTRVWEAKDNQKSSTLTSVESRRMVAIPVPSCVAQRGRYASGNRSVKVEGGTEQFYEARPDGKTSTLTTVQKDNMAAEPIPQYAIPCEWSEDDIPTKAISGADGKTYTVYSVQNGQITIKGKTYPIKLIDGYYIIRKLTVSECKRLQTVPEWYDFSVISNSQAYKCLGNGWTCDVITHLINACLK